MSPLQQWSDFFPGLKGFSRPSNFCDYKERLISNLLYYQTNYLVLSIIVFIFAWFKDPVGVITCLAMLYASYVVSVWAGNRQPLVSLKRWSPLAFLITIIAVTHSVIYSFARVRALLQLTTFMLSVITQHATFRYRGISKVAYTKEAEGLGGSPMGILLMVREKKR